MFFLLILIAFKEVNTARVSGSISVTLSVSSRVVSFVKAEQLDFNISATSSVDSKSPQSSTIRLKKSISDVRVSVETAWQPSNISLRKGNSLPEIDIKSFDGIKVYLDKGDK